MPAKVLVGVLNWGLGHAARSVPIIRDFVARGYEPIIASDGLALRFLREHFPNAVFETLPELRIQYPANSRFFMFGMLINGFIHRNWPKAEKQVVQKLVEYYRPQLLFSDSRPFFWHPSIHGIYMTHQLQVRAGKLSRIVNYFHHQWMEKFDEIYVPDFATPPGLSGKLGHPDSLNAKVKYIGPLTRFRNKGPKLETDWLLLLSGPEKQRTLLEELLIKHHQIFRGNVCLVRGTPDARLKRPYPSHWQVFNLLSEKQLARYVRGAKTILSRSGYTSVMDWYLLQKKAILVPTPGQLEQEYLAHHLAQAKLFPFLRQEQLPYLEQIDFDRFFTNKLKNHIA